MIRWHPEVEKLLIPANEIHPHYRNPNNADVEEITAAVMRFGVWRPVYVSRRTKDILAGAGLYEALLGLLSDVIPVFWVDDESDEEAIGILLGDNAIGKLAYVDFGLEIPLLKELLETPHGLLGVGYPEEVFQARLDLMEEDSAGLSSDMAWIRCPHCHQRFATDRIM